MKDNNITINQTIPFPTVFSKEKQLGQVRSEQASVAHYSNWKDLSVQIQSSYESIRYLKAKVAVLENQDSLMAAIEKRVEIKIRILLRVHQLGISTKENESYLRTC